MNNGPSPKPAIFLDRDGTLIEEVNFLSRVDDMKIFDYTYQAVSALKDRGYLVIVVTNQSGIGRNIYTEADMHAIHDAIQIALEGAIDGFYFCPHLPCDGCACRKPGLGMIRSACADFAIDVGNSWMVGDKKIDIETGANAGMRSAMVMTGYGREHFPALHARPDVVAETLLEAVLAIGDHPMANPRTAFF